MALKNQPGYRPTAVCLLCKHGFAHGWRGGWRGWIFWFFPMSLFEKQRVRAALSVRVLPSVAAVLVANPWAVGATSLDEVVVSATRTEQRFEDVLADITIWDREAIDKSGSGYSDDQQWWPCNDHQRVCPGCQHPVHRCVFGRCAHGQPSHQWWSDMARHPFGFD